VESVNMAPEFIPVDWKAWHPSRSVPSSILSSIMTLPQEAI